MGPVRVRSCIIATPGEPRLVAKIASELYDFMSRSCCRRRDIWATTAGRPASAEPGSASAAGRKCSSGRGDLRHSRRRSGSAVPTVRGSKPCASSRPRRPAWDKGRGSRTVRRRPGPGRNRHQQQRACRAAWRLRAAGILAVARGLRRLQGDHATHRWRAPELVLLPCRGRFSSCAPSLVCPYVPADSF